jgi:hypothetical protein
MRAAVFAGIAIAVVSIKKRFGYHIRSSGPNIFHATLPRIQSHMRHFLLAVVWVAAFLALNLGAGQSGRHADLKMQGIQAFEKGRYSETAGKLEEIWEEDQSDPKVAEYLAMGYLYGEKSVEKAAPVMQKAIADGGQASFLVVHSHEHGGFLHGDVISQFCTGRISIVPGKLIFVSDDQPEHNVTVFPADLTDFSVLGGAPGRIHIKAAGKTYNFRVKSETRKEAVLLTEVAQQNLKP